MTPHFIRLSSPYRWRRYWPLTLRGSLTALLLLAVVTLIVLNAALYWAGRRFPQ